MVLDALNYIKDQTGRVADLPLVLPHGSLRKLRNDGERSSQVDLRHVPFGLRAGPRARGADEKLSRAARPGGRHFGFSGEARESRNRGSFGRRKSRSQEGEYLQTPEQLEAYKQFSMCINCMLCYAACPVYGLDPLFSGPAAIALAQRYNMDSRDEGASERLDILSQHDGIWGCTFVGECTQVCPKHVDPAGAIQQYKLTAAHGMDEVLCAAARSEVTDGQSHRVSAKVVPSARLHLLVAGALAVFEIHPSGS